MYKQTCSPHRLFQQWYSHEKYWPLVENLLSTTYEWDSEWARPMKIYIHKFTILYLGLFFWHWMMPSCIVSPRCFPEPGKGAVDCCNVFSTSLQCYIFIRHSSTRSKRGCKSSRIFHGFCGCSIEIMHHSAGLQYTRLSFSSMLMNEHVCLEITANPTWFLFLRFGGF